jgi:hypothetical protein
MTIIRDRFTASAAAGIAASLADATAQIDALTGALDRLDVSSRTFAESLLSQFRRRGSLSPRQWPHVAALIQRAARPAGRLADNDGNGGFTLPAAGLATLQGVFGNATRAGITPGIRATINGARLRVTAPSRRSAFAGQPVLFVRLGDTYAGRIANGAFLPRSATGADAMPALRTLLESPLGTLAEIGRATGTCCYCARELTDPRSVSMGYGPICAGNYGLPWGDTPAPPEIAAEAANIAGRLTGPRVTAALRAAAAAAAERERGRPSITDAYNAARARSGPQAAANTSPHAPDELDDEDRMFMGGA